MRVSAVKYNRYTPTTLCLEFHQSHHLSWGKLYKPEDVKVSWHVPNEAEIAFALRLFRELVEPTLSRLENLLDDGE